MLSWDAEDLDIGTEMIVALSAKQERIAGCATLGTRSGMQLGAMRTPFKVQAQALLHQGRSELTTVPGRTTLPAWCARLKCNLVTNLQTLHPFTNFQNHPAYPCACCGHIQCELRNLMLTEGCQSRYG